MFFCFKCCKCLNIRWYRCVSSECSSISDAKLCRRLRAFFAEENTMVGVSVLRFSTSSDWSFIVDFSKVYFVVLRSISAIFLFVRLMMSRMRLLTSE